MSGGKAMRPLYFRCPSEAKDVYALKALSAGVASESQQKTALDWIIKTAAMTYQPTFLETDRASAFAEGRRFVGLEIVALLHLDLSTLKDDSNA